MRRLSIGIFSIALICGLSFVSLPPALAASCDLNTCVAECQKVNPRNATGNICTTNCLQTIEQRKKARQCK